jgi:sec-independent protein translocase protein TatA
MIKQIGPTELLIVLGIVLLLFGAGRVSSLGKELGTAIKEAKKGIEVDEEAPPDAGADKQFS